MIQGMGEMKRAIDRENEESVRSRFASTLVIAAAIIAAVRLAREEDVSRPSPRVTFAIGQSVALARAILNRVIGR
jgi:hypothetical protein